MLSFLRMHAGMFLTNCNQIPLYEEYDWNFWRHFHYFLTNNTTFNELKLSKVSRGCAFSVILGTGHPKLAIFGYSGNNFVKTHKYSRMCKITNTNTSFKQKRASLWKAVGKCYLNVTSKAFIQAFFILLAKDQRLPFVWLKMFSPNFKKSFKKSSR